MQKVSGACGRKWNLSEAAAPLRSHWSGGARHASHQKYSFLFLKDILSGFGFTMGRILSDVWETRIRKRRWAGETVVAMGTLSTAAAAVAGLR